jgi:hypothetical protein
MFSYCLDNTKRHALLTDIKCYSGGKRRQSGGSHQNHQQHAESTCVLFSLGGDVRSPLGKTSGTN